MEKAKDLVSFMGAVAVGIVLAGVIGFMQYEAAVARAQIPYHWMAIG